eukprot:CAMPEP_0119329396 /NCGR_PEP_ID=MMETSP1333-20130426/75717_1 /TAXON_ID=418940 /ORGANISM="Scyphosphaera apsteinii, Strain RCC1455" /LENGTH=379 /DNA_ID=CAMNT_0007338501 /DNA_START=35 /DNA_END=1171 /DNA_ORIENTATION=+
MPFSPFVDEDETVPTGIKRSRYYWGLMDRNKKHLHLHETAYVPPPRINPVARELLAGSADPSSTLYVLSGHRDELQLIYEALRAVWDAELARATTDATQQNKPLKRCAFDHVDNVMFPPATDIHINMMPFVMGEQASLPQSYHGYWPMIEECVRNCRGERGHVGYLTIHEGSTRRGESQRRPGLHTEGFMGPLVEPRTPGTAQCRRAAFWHPWGMGNAFKCSRAPDDPRTASSMSPGVYEGGVFMASSVGGTCRVWDASLRYSELVGALGAIEHLRHPLSRAAPSCLMQASELFWLTDSTPHESVPLAADTYRQYFRLVTSNVGVWYAAHSTPNPLGVLPPPAVQVLTVNKFTGREPGQGLPEEAPLAVEVAAKDAVGE